MTLDQLPLLNLTTPAGIAAIAVVIRQVIEMAKKSFLPWIDAGNERKATFIAAAIVYLLWLIVYGNDLNTDGPLALAAFWAAGTAAIGTNEAVDAAKGVVASNVGGTSEAAADADAARSGANARVVDDSVDRSVPLESGPDLNLLVNGGDVDSEVEESPPDPAVAPVG